METPRDAQQPTTENRPLQAPAANFPDNSQLSFNFSPVTALKEGDPDDGDEGRQQRGLAIAATVRMEKIPVGYKVPSQSGNGSYVVSPGATPYCSCPDFERRQAACKHVYAVEFTIQREELEDGSVTETRTARVTYSQDWPAYNAAQEHEQEHFVALLRDLCDTIPEPPAKATGRPRLPLADRIFASTLKVYGLRSQRRSMSDIRNAADQGLLSSTLSTAAVWRTMEDETLYPVLVDLIERSALPMRAIEVDFAGDATGFSASVYDRWFDHRYGKKKSQAKWVKVHAMCGRNTKILTACEVTEGDASESPYLPSLVNTTDKGFEVREVSVDKGYLSRANLHAIDAVGATPFIPFKSNSVARSRSKKYGRDLLWERIFHFYKYNRAEYMEHYHKRNSIEVAFYMVKSKFGPAVRSKNLAAQMNEALLKCLCHNICVLIHSAYELGIVPIFDEANPPATKLPAPLQKAA